MVRAWGALAADQRLAALAAIGLFFSMFLPWYDESGFAIVGRSPQPATLSLSAFQAFSFVEAAVLLVGAGVLYLLFARAEERAFHLPGGDGIVIMAAGGWAGLLIFYRMLDKPGTSHTASRLTDTIGLRWGIFIALAAAIALAVAGSRVRSAHHPEPVLEVPIPPRGRGAGAPAPPGRAFGEGGALPAAADPPTARTRRLGSPPPAPNRCPSTSRRRPPRARAVGARGRSRASSRSRTQKKKKRSGEPEPAAGGHPQAGATDPRAALRAGGYYWGPRCGSVAPMNRIVVTTIVTIPRLISSVDLMM